MKKTYFTGLLAMVLVVLGCSTIDCPLNNRVYAKYKLAGEVKTLNKTLTIAADLGDGNDSVIINKAQKTDSFTLPMSYQQDEDVFYYEVANPSNRYRDTVKIRKTNIPQGAVFKRGGRILGNHTQAAPQRSHHMIGWNIVLT